MFPRYLVASAFVASCIAAFVGCNKRDRHVDLLYHARSHEQLKEFGAKRYSFCTLAQVQAFDKEVVILSGCAGSGECNLDLHVYLRISDGYRLLVYQRTSREKIRAVGTEHVLRITAENGAVLLEIPATAFE